MILSSDPLDWPRYAGLTLERYNAVRAVAGSMVQEHLEDRDWRAFVEYRSLTDMEEINVLWGILRNYSSLRSAIKRMSRDEQNYREREG